MDERAESANHTACVRPPSREAGQPTVDTENAAACAQTAESGNTEFSRNNAPVREAMNQYLDYLAGGAMLPPVLQAQDPQEDADMPPPEPELPAFMLVDTNDESWRNEPLPPPPPPPPPNQNPAALANRTTNNAALRAATITRTGKKTTKASIKLAALNIRGNGKEKKWWKLNQIINRERIGISIVGEAHLDEDRLESIDQIFKRQLLIKYSKDPRTPNANGVAIVINRNQLKVEDIHTREVIPGRALLLETKKHDGKPLSILGVYAPNAPSENAQFWKDIQAWFGTHPSRTKTGHPRRRYEHSGRRS
jgi:hypothetical protein